MVRCTDDADSTMLSHPLVLPDLPQTLSAQEHHVCVGLCVMVQNGSRFFVSLCPCEHACVLV